MRVKGPSRGESLYSKPNLSACPTGIPKEFVHQSIQSRLVSSVLPFAWPSPSELSVSAGYRGASHPPLLFLPANPKNPAKCKSEGQCVHVCVHVCIQGAASQVWFLGPSAVIPTHLSPRSSSPQPPLGTQGRVAGRGSAWALPTSAHPPTPGASRGGQGLDR